MSSAIGDIEEGIEGGGTGLFSTTLKSCSGSSCRSLYALALMFPPKLSSHTHAGAADAHGPVAGGAARWGGREES